MSTVLRDPLDTLTQLPERSQLDAILAEDQWKSRRAIASTSGDSDAFAHMSDLEVACAYRRDADLEDALYCELHRRGLNPWALAPNIAVDASP